MKLGDALDFVWQEARRFVAYRSAGDPAGLVDGAFWYDTAADSFRGRANGASFTFPSSSTGIANVVEDATPQLGGQLDVNGNPIGDGTRELISFVEDGAAVNHIEIENEATGSGPVIRSTGDDTNVDMNFDAKGSGSFLFSGDIGVTGTVDGRDVGADGAILDGIEPGADVTDTANVDAAGATMNADTSLVGNGWFLDDDTMSADDATKTVSQQSLVAYIAAQLSSLPSGSIDEYDAATDSPSLDDGTPIAGIQESDAWVVTVAGTFFTNTVQPGDYLIAKQDNPTIEAHWIVVSRQLDNATEGAAGVTRIADQATVDAGVDDFEYVTALKLRTSDVARKYSTLVGDGATNPVVVTHNLGSLDVTLSIREVSTGEHVLATPTVTSANALTIEFGTTATSNQYSVTVVG